MVISLYSKYFILISQKMCCLRFKQKTLKFHKINPNNKINCETPQVTIEAEQLLFKLK